MFSTEGAKLDIIDFQHLSSYLSIFFLKNANRERKAKHALPPLVEACVDFIKSP